MIKKRIIVLVAVCLAAAIFIGFDLGQYFELDRFKAWVATQPIQAAIAFALIYMLVASLSLPGVGPLSLVGGAVFGFWWGVLIVSFASSIGATLGMLISRTLLREWVQRKFSKFLTRVNDGVRRDGVLFLVTLRLIPPIPFFIINLVFGMTNMGVRKFYLASQIGMLPATMLFINAGASLGRVENITFGDLFSVEVILSFAAMIAFPFMVKALLKHTRLGQEAEELVDDE